MPDWVEHAVWWHVYPLGFTGAEPEPGRGVTHRLGKLQDWLDYAVNLGASGLALGPVFRSGSHGYDTVDHYAIDPRLGDEADFRALLTAAHGRGLRVLLDGVFNHVGRGFEAFQRAIGQGPASPDARWFRMTWPAGAPPGAEPEYATFEGPPWPGRAQPRRARGGEVRDGCDVPLAAGGRGRLAAGRRLRRAGDVLGLGAAAGPGPASGCVPDGRSHPRRLRTVRWRLRPGLGHPVRAVEGHLELAQRPQPLRAGLGPGAAQRVPGHVRAVHLHRQPRRHPAGQPAHRRPPHRPCPGAVVHPRRDASRLLRRRAGFPRGQGRPARGRRQHQARVPGHAQRTWRRMDGPPTGCTRTSSA